MSQISFTLLLNSKKIKIPTRFSRLADASTDIYNALIFSPDHQYQIKSDISENVLKSFIQYWVTGENPDICVENITEYYDLSEEFNLLKEQVQQADNLFSSELTYFKGLSNKIYSNTSFYEEKISIQLDNYLQKYGEEIMKLPIQTLYNIFNHPKCVLKDHNLAYSLILKQYNRTGVPNIFILLKKLDGTKLSQQNLNDCITNRKSRLDNMPYLQRKKETEAKFCKLKEIVNEQQTKIDNYTAEISLIKEKRAQEIDNIQKTIKINTNKIERIELKHQEDIKKIENTQNLETNSIKKTLQDQEQKIRELQINHLDDIEKVKRQLNDNDKEMSKLAEKEIELPSRIQTVRRFNKKEHHRKNPGKVIDLFYNSTQNDRFDGVIHYLSIECNGNVHDQGAVEVTSSSVIPVLPILPGLPIMDDKSHMPIFAVDLNENTSFISDIKPNSWICYDFVDAKVKPNAYSIRSYVDGISFMINWCVEGSNDKIKWNVLDQRTNEHSIDGSGKSNTFFINEKNINNFYRYIRLKQTGKNSKDNDSFCISAFEIFGSFYE